MEQIKEKKSLQPALSIDFDPSADIVFLTKESLPHHPNALSFLAEFEDHDPISET